MTDEDKHEVFMAAGVRVSEKAWKDYAAWRDAVGLEQMRSGGNWVSERFDWCMEHPEWGEAMMLVLLEGKW